MTTQELVDLVKCLPWHLKPKTIVDTHFTIRLRTNGEWVTIIKTRYFNELIRGYTLVNSMVEGTAVFVKVTLHKDNEETILQEWQAC